MGVSLDGVMVPMIDGDRKGKREQAKAQGKSPSGPSGYQEVGCGTISFYDRYGERLLTRRMGRMPQSHKVVSRIDLDAQKSTHRRDHGGLDRTTGAQGRQTG